MTKRGEEENRGAYVLFVVRGVSGVSFRLLHGIGGFAVAAFRLLDLATLDTSPPHVAPSRRVPQEGGG